MLNHIFYWLSYCKKWNFYLSQANLSLNDISHFPEAIIRLIAQQFFNAVSLNPLSLYEHIEDALIIPKGQINFKRYISNGLSNANFQRIDCDFDSFQFDNKVNRVVKFCCRLFLSQANTNESIELLQNSIFILDEVEDVFCTTHDIDAISLSPLYQDYHTVLDHCRLILTENLYSSQQYELSQWSLLLPMDIIFEEFIAGFLQQHFSDNWTIETQKSDQYLAELKIGGVWKNAFQMRHDILMISKQQPSRKIIIDTKYKLRSSEQKQDYKKGISQVDMYQMLSYAYRRGIKDLILIYPNTSEQSVEPDLFKIKKDTCDEVNIFAIDAPFWSNEGFQSETPFSFADLETRLKQQLRKVFNRINSDVIISRGEVIETEKT